MKKLTLVIFMLAFTPMLIAQDILLPTEHGLITNQPAWYQSQNQVQDFSISNGYNWWSSFIDLSDGGLTSLQNALNGDASLIKSNVAFTTYTPSTNSWSGELHALENSMMYLILISSNSSNFQMEGVAVNPAEVDIPYTNGWNWIGYPCSSAMSIGDALANYNASNNDQIKSQSVFATYSANTGQWIGTLEALEPGMGYILLSNTSSSSSFHYGNRSKDAAVTNPTLHTVWHVNPYNFAQNMTIIASVKLQGSEIRDDHYELGLFLGDECRGTTPLIYVDATDSYLAFLTGYGNEGDALQFRLLDKNTGAVYTTDGQQCITYSDNASFGQLDGPYSIEFRDILSTEETLAGMLDIFPNPMSSSQDLHISLPESQTTGQLTVQVVNLLGQVIREQTFSDNSCTLGGLSSGVYTIRILANHTSIYNNKLIVK